MRIVVIQRKLVRALCALPVGSTVDLAWLQQKAWPKLDANWVRRFWKNDKRRRQGWMNTIAEADATAKNELLQIMKEQHAFRGLYGTPPTQRVQQTDRAFWLATEVREAMRDLMLDFYDPLFYEAAGYPASIHRGTGLLKRSHLARDPLLPVCPYTDGTMQRPQLDHFLAKEAFPFICLHPDNLIPSGSDANTIKSAVLPLDWTAADQASDWFHPRLRSGSKRFAVLVSEQQDKTLAIQLEPLHETQLQRVLNLDRLFELASFWGRDVMGDVQFVQEDLASELRVAGVQADQTLIRKKLAERHRLHRNGIGRFPSSVYQAALYAFAASSTPIIDDLIKQCGES